MKGNSMKNQDQMFQVEQNLVETFGAELSVVVCLKLIYDLTTDEQWQNLVDTTTQARRLQNV